MNKWIEILIGLVLFTIPIVFWALNLYGFGTSAMEFLKGGLMWIVLMFGLLFIILGVSDLRQ